MSDVDTYPKPAHGWTCFFCGETFTTEGGARDHFGNKPPSSAGCQIKAGEERGLLMALRRSERQLAEARERQAALFDAIKHGDDGHRQWLKTAIDAHFAGQPLPPYVSSGKDARLAAMEKVVEAATMLRQATNDSHDLHNREKRRGAFLRVARWEMALDQALAALPPPKEDKT